MLSLRLAKTKGGDGFEMFTDFLLASRFESERPERMDSLHAEVQCIANLDAPTFVPTRWKLPSKHLRLRSKWEIRQ